MSDFRPPKNQEELDTMIKDRLKRERGKIIRPTEDTLQRIIADLVDLYRELDKSM